MEQFYVYGLVDPRNETIFYIGKGKGKEFFNIYPKSLIYIVHYWKTSNN